MDGEPDITRSFREEDIGEKPSRGDERGFTLVVRLDGRLPSGCLARFTATNEDEPWRVDGFVGRTRSDGPLVIVNATIDPGDFIGGVTPELVKGIRLRELRLALVARIEYEFAWQRARGAQRWPLAPKGQRHRLRAAVEANTEAPVGRGRPALSDEFLYGIAREYLDLETEGYGHERGKGILNEMARRRGRQRETVRDWIAKARKRGFLTRGVPGQAGAQPGPRYLEYEQTQPQEGDNGDG